MDNLRRNSRNRQPKGNVDGMLGSSKGRGSTTGSNIFKTRANSVSRIGGFGSTDGFYPNKQSQIKSTPKKPTTGRQPARGEDGSIVLQMPDGGKSSSHKGHKNKRHVFKKAFNGLLVAVIILSGFTFGKAYLKFGQIFKGGGSAAALGKNVDPARLNGEGDGRVNILMLGKGGDGHTAPDLTDTILVASINPIQKEAAILSIPRDLYVKTADQGSMKINAVYANAKQQALSELDSDDKDRNQKAEDAGIKALEQTVEGTMGIPIHYYSMVDFDGFKQAIDTVGGVDVNAPKEVYETMRLDGRNYVLNVQPGQQHFDGFRALAYARSRYTSPRGDFDRSERQRAILVALKEKILTLGTLTNPVRINQLVGDFGDHVSTNLSVDELMRLYEIGKDINSSNIASVGLADPPNNYVVTDNIGGQSVVVPRAGLNNYKEIQNFVRNKLKDGYLVDENASILILNGTYTVGLAGRTAEELKSYGYNLAPVGDASTKGYQDTVIVDLRGGSKKYTRRYLEQRFKTNVVSSLPDSSINPGTADFVIILGQNEVSRLEN